MPGRRLLKTLALLAATGALSLPIGSWAAPPPDPDPTLTCHAETCGGVDPVESGCEVGARTTQFKRLPGGGRLELRWNFACDANWARINTGVPLGTTLIVENTDNDWQTTATDAATYSRTPMVDGSRSARAGVEINGVIIWTLWD